MRKANGGGAADFVPEHGAERVPILDKRRLALLESIQRRVLWLSTLMVHHANRIRPNEEGAKVGGHQASSASVVGILTALYLDFLRAGDRVSIKPHASPAFHAVQFLLGNLERDFLTTLRTFHGLQAYPSRTKDPDPVDFSTGSVGLGSVAPNFAALVDAYCASRFGRHGLKHRFISVVGDAELDEGSVWEAIIEPAFSGIDNIIWVVDLNRQSLDRVVPGMRVQRLRAMFRANDWVVIDAKYGRRLEQAFAQPGGDRFRALIDAMPNEEYQRLLRVPAKELRERLIGGHPAVGLANLLGCWSDAELADLLADLGGHDLATLRTALLQADEAQAPAVIFAYTIKGWGLPIAGEPLNHSALLTNQQIDDLRASLGIVEANEFDRFPGGSPEAEICAEAARRLRTERREPSAPIKLSIPPELVDSRMPKDASTQLAFALALADLARSAPRLAQRIVTASPDVAVSTNLGGWINRVGVFATTERQDFFSDAGPRLLTWREGPHGRHIELGISENNLFLLLGQLGLSQELFDELLLPIGTLYDPFICRGLDAFIYGLYAGAKFIVVATPSGVTLSSEGGAHQSIITPAIGLELPELAFWEPCFALETEWILLEALRGVANRVESSYLRLSTRPIDQTLFSLPGDPASRERLRQQVLSGAYCLIDRSAEPGYRAGVNAATVACAGAVVPEAIAASNYLREDDIFVNVVNVTSVDRLFRRHHSAVQAAVDAAWEGRVSPLVPPAAFPSPGTVPLVTVLDAHPHTFAWLPAALGTRGLPLGVTGFGRSGTRAELYRSFGIGMESIVGACVAAIGEGRAAG